MDIKKILPQYNPVQETNVEAVEFAKEDEQIRLANKKDQILQALRVAGQNGVLNADLSKISLRYGAHLGRLYQEGYKVSKEALGDGLFRYTLTYIPVTPVKRERALDVLIKAIEAEDDVIDSNDLLRLLRENNIAVKYKANTYKNS